MSSDRIDAISRNLLINGAQELAQRSPAAAATLTTTPSYLAVDRFRVAYTGMISGTPQASRAIVASGQSWKYGNQLSVRRNGTTCVLRWEQRIESIYAAEMIDYGIGSFAVKAKAPVAGASALLTLNVPTVADNYTAVATILSQSLSSNLGISETRLKLENFSLPSSVERGLAVVLEITLPSGTDGANIDSWIREMMLVPYRKAPEKFCRAGGSFGGEVRECQRYCCKNHTIDVASDSGNTPGAPIFIGRTTSEMHGTAKFPTGMRVAPTITLYGDTPSGGPNKVYRFGVGDLTVTGINTSTISTSGFSTINDSGLGITTGALYACNYLAIAEL
jgi:hypothetical protein